MSAALDKAAPPPPRSTEKARAGLSARLRACLPEIEEATLTRVHAVSDPSRIGDPEYADGLRRAVSVAIEYGLAGIEHGERRLPPIPSPLLDQARRAALNGVSLDTVMRRCFAGYALLGDFLTREAERDPRLEGRTLSRLLREQAALFDGLLAAIGEMHSRESQYRFSSTGERRAARVRQLLDGELLDISELAYDLDLHHVGVIATGPGADQTMRQLACHLDRRLLLSQEGAGTVWCWFGGRRLFDLDEVVRHLADNSPASVSLAIGEAAQGLAGWRLTHHQAKAAFTVLQRSSKRMIRYADVALLASMLQDELLATSLRRLYLAPLEGERDGGVVLRTTLRAYFASGRHISSAASAMGTSRQTVAKRLRTAENRLGRPLDLCATDLEAALRIDDASQPGCMAVAAPVSIESVS